MCQTAERQAENDPWVCQQWSQYGTRVHVEDAHICVFWTGDRQNLIKSFDFNNKTCSVAAGCTCGYEAGRDH